MLWAVGDAMTLDESGSWLNIGDGYAVAGPGDEHAAYRKAQSWFMTEPVTDLTGRVWHIPRIIDGDGERVFRVAYGADFTPALTPEQYRMMDIAKAARDGIVASESGVQDVDMQMCCRWVADMLACAYHLPPAAIGALCILDDALVVGAMRASCQVNAEMVV
jgi:hypothetical protein